MHDRQMQGVEKMKGEEDRMIKRAGFLMGGGAGHIRLPTPPYVKTGGGSPRSGRRA